MLSISREMLCLPYAGFFVIQVNFLVTQTKKEKKKKKTVMTDKNFKGQYTPSPKYQFLPDSPHTLYPCRGRVKNTKNFYYPFISLSIFNLDRVSPVDNMPSTD